MKKLESKLFENFKENQVDQLEAVIGGNRIKSCQDGDSDTCTFDEETGPDDLVLDGGCCD